MAVRDGCRRVYRRDLSLKKQLDTQRGKSFFPLIYMYPFYILSTVPSPSTPPLRVLSAMTPRKIFLNDECHMVRRGMWIQMFSAATLCNRSSASQILAIWTDHSSIHEELFVLITLVWSSRPNQWVERRGVLYTFWVSFIKRKPSFPHLSHPLYLSLRRKPRGDTRASLVASKVWFALLWVKI